MAFVPPKFKFITKRHAYHFKGVVVIQVAGLMRTGLADFFLFQAPHKAHSRYLSGASYKVPEGQYTL
jgi:hypothetical protein